MIFASFLIIMMVIDSSMEAFDASAFVDKTNELRGAKLAKGMNKLIFDSKLSVTTVCQSHRTYVDAQDVSNSNRVTMSFILKAATTDSVSDLPAAVTTVKTGGELGDRKKYSDCATHVTSLKTIRCQIYFIFFYGSFTHANVKIKGCSDTDGDYTAIFFAFKTKYGDFTTYQMVESQLRDPCDCRPERQCEFVPPSSGTLTSRFCIPRPPNEDAALVTTFNSWRAASVDLPRDTSLQANAVSSAKASCNEHITLDHIPASTLVRLMTDGSKMETSKLGFKALLDSYNADGTVNKYHDCPTLRCKAFLILKSNQATKVGIAAMNCESNGAAKTVVAIVVSPEIFVSRMDKEYSPLTVLNDWRKSVVSTVSPVTSTAAIKSKADTEVAKCATAVNVDDAEVALVSDKLGSKFTDVDAIRDQLKIRLDAYKTAAKGKARQEDCSTLSGDDQRFCKIFFMMIYAAYTNGEVAVKNDCSDAKTVITFALSKKPANYEYVNAEGVVDPPKSTTTAKGGESTTTAKGGESTTPEAGGSNNTQGGQLTTTQPEGPIRNAASTVFTGLGYGISLLIIVLLFH